MGNVATVTTGRNGSKVTNTHQLFVVIAYASRYRATRVLTRKEEVLSGACAEFPESPLLQMTGVQM